MEQGCRAAGVQVTNVRFANSHVGYAYSNENGGLFLTTDGAQSWQLLPAGPTNVEALEITAGTVFAIATAGSGCPGACHPKLDASAVGATTWHSLGAPDISEGFGEQVVAQVKDLYYLATGHPAGGAMNAQGRIARSEDGGLSWQTQHDPCGPTPTSDSTGEFDARSLAAAPGGFLAVLCAPRLPGSYRAFVLTSSDAGATFGGHLPVGSVSDAPLALSAGSASSLAVVLVSGTSEQIEVSHDGGPTWRTTLTQPVGNGSDYAFLGYQDANTARAVLNGTGTLFSTSDGGDTWLTATPAP